MSKLVKMKRLLVIEDDADIANLIDINFSPGEYELTLVADGRDGFLTAVDHNFDLIILDISLPNMNGFDICKELRAVKVNTAILMLTARKDEIDKVLGLEIGADDYLTKPFSIRELQARVKAILRRKELNQVDEGTKQKQIISTGDLSIDLKRMKTTLKGERLNLTPKEFELLSLFAENPGRTFTRERILNKIWGYDFEGYEHTVNSHINRLRAKIEDDIKEPKYILTSWGTGYRFTED